MAAPRTSSAPNSSWQLLKGLINETVGPLAILTYGASKLVSVLSGAAFNAQKMREALNASAEASTLRREFQGIGLSADAAQVKVKELTSEASKGGFNLESLGLASKNLQVIGGEALNTSANLKRVQDAAAASGAPIDAMATALGALFQSLKTDGAGAGEAAARVASFGVISQQTAQKVAQLSSSGAPLSSSLRLVEADLSKTKGASDDLASSLTGLKAQLQAISQEGNAKIGDQYVEGEKAALRAAIGFQKVKNVISETGSSIFSPVVNGFHKIVEAISGMVSSSASLTVIREIFGSVLTAALTLLSTSIVAATLGLVGFLGWLARIPLVASVGAAAMTALSRATGAYFALLGSGVGAIALVASAIAVIGLKAWQSLQGIEALNKALKETSINNAEKIGSLEKKSAEVVTPEDKKRVLGEYDTAIEQNKEDQRKSDEAVQKAEQSYKFKAGLNEIFTAGFGDRMGYNILSEDGRKRFDQTTRSAVENASGAGWFDFLGAGAEELKTARTQQEIVRNQGVNLRNSRQRLADNYKVGLSADENQKEQQGQLLEDRIRREALQRLEATSSPAAAVLVAEQAHEGAMASLNNAQQYTRTYTEKDAVAIDKAQQKVGGGQELQAASVELENAKSQYQGDKSSENKSRLEAAQIRFKQASSNSNLPQALNELRDVGNNVTTRRGKIEADLAYRQALISEGGSANAEKLSIIASSADPETKKKQRAESDLRIRSINDRIRDLGGGDFNAGQEMLSPRAIQSLQNQSKFEAETNNPVTRREEEAAAARNVQIAKEAQASAAAALSLEQQRVQLENELSTITEGTASAVAKARAEGELQTQQLQKALIAAQALEAAEKGAAEAGAAYKSSPTTENKTRLDSALSAADSRRNEAIDAGAGGKGVSELSKQLEITRSIGQEKIRQAELARAAAEGETAAAMRRLNTEKLLLQLKQGRNIERDGGAAYTGPNEGQIRIRALEAEVDFRAKAYQASLEKQSADEATTQPATPSQPTATPPASREVPQPKDTVPSVREDVIMPIGVTGQTSNAPQQGSVFTQILDGVRKIISILLSRPVSTQPATATTQPATATTQPATATTQPGTATQSATASQPATATTQPATATTQPATATTQPATATTQPATATQSATASQRSESDKKAAKYGVLNTRPEDAKVQLERAQNELDLEKASQRESASDFLDRKQLESLRLTQQFPSSQQDYLATKSKADQLEDKIRTREKQRELGEQGIDTSSGPGQRLVESMVKQDRIRDEISEIGDPRVSDMQSVGGDTRRSLDPRIALVRRLREEQGNADAAMTAIRATQPATATTQPATATTQPATPPANKESVEERREMGKKDIGVIHGGHENVKNNFKTTLSEPFKEGEKIGVRRNGKLVGVGEATKDSADLSEYYGGVPQNYGSVQMPKDYEYDPDDRMGKLTKEDVESLKTPYQRRMEAQKDGRLRTDGITDKTVDMPPTMTIEETPLYKQRQKEETNKGGGPAVPGESIVDRAKRLESERTALLPNDTSAIQRAELERPHSWNTTRTVNGITVPGIYEANDPGMGARPKTPRLDAFKDRQDTPVGAEDYFGWRNQFQQKKAGDLNTDSFKMKRVGDPNPDIPRSKKVGVEGASIAGGIAAGSGNDDLKGELREVAGLLRSIAGQGNRSYAMTRNIIAGTNA